MTVGVVVERSGASVRAALLETSSADAEAFEREFLQALTRAAESLDLTEAERVLTHWWGVAHLRVQPLSDSEVDTIRRFRAGEEVGWPLPAAYRAARGQACL